MPKVVILGGGVAGMSAAHELIERGFEVAVYEKKPQYLGGKARSVNVPGSDQTGVNPPTDARSLPGEHGFRFFPGFYRHITDTMRRIPYTNAAGVKNQHGVYDNLVEVQRVGILRYGKAPISTIVSFPQSLADIEAALALLHQNDTGLLPGEARFFAGRVWQLMTSCQTRRDLDYEKIGWWEFMEADAHSPAYRSLLVEGLTRSLVAANAKFASTKTGGDIFLQLLFNVANPGIHADRVLNGPTNKVWLEPWEKYLTEKGVTFHKGALVQGLVYEKGRITSVTIRDWQKAQAWVDAQGAPATPVPTPDPFAYDPPAAGDYYLLATPVEVASVLLPDNAKRELTSLDSLDVLASDVAWMNGIQFYLNQEVGVVRGHCLYVDTEWALTSISQTQFWPDFDLTQRGDGRVKCIFSVDVSDWSVPFPGPAADVPFPAPPGTDLSALSLMGNQCTTFDQIAHRVWAQLKKSLNIDPKNPVLRDDMLQGVYADGVHRYHGYYLDHSLNEQAPPTTVDPAYTKVGATVVVPKLVNHEPLLVNTVNSWALRPEAHVGIPNLFLASDYVRTNTDLATMEGANEAARRAVNCILDASGVQAPECSVWKLHEPALFLPLKGYDAWRYKRGLPYSIHPPFWLKGIMVVWGVVYGIFLFFEVIISRIRDKI